MLGRRYLCVCQGGNVRSVCLAWHLKNQGHEALSAGLDYLSDETMALLYTWADVVIVMEERFKVRVPERFHYKLGVCEVGPDIYGNPMNKVLKIMVKTWLSQNVVD